MNRLRSFLICVLGILVLGSLITIPEVRAQDKPLLSEEIKKAIEADGPDAAKKRFNELYPAQKDRYEVDMKAIADLSAKYMQEGNMSAGMAIVDMMTTLAQASYAEAMDSQSEMMKNLENQAQAHQATAEKQAPPPLPEKYDPGPSRDDLDRFVGMYADPEREEETRQLFVTVSCNGFLVAGAYWGDASPWWLRSDGDAAFSMKDQYQSIQINFALDAAGKAVSMSHDLDFIPNPLRRVGPLPEGWEECVMPPGG